MTFIDNNVQELRERAAAALRWRLFNKLMLNSGTTGLDLLPLPLAMGTAGTNTNTKQGPARKFLLVCSHRERETSRQQQKWQKDDKKRTCLYMQALLLLASRARAARQLNQMLGLSISQKQNSLFTLNKRVFYSNMDRIRIQKNNILPKFLVSDLDLYSLSLGIS